MANEIINGVGSCRVLFGPFEIPQPCIAALILTRARATGRAGVRLQRN